MANFYYVKFDRPVRVKSNAGADVLRHHVYVVADSVEEALAAVRERHPNAEEPSGVNKQNHTEGHEIIFARDCQKTEGPA